MPKKTVIIGIDGVPYGLMDNLSDRGVMPNFQDLKSQGIFQKMRSSIPEISSVAWSSIITGKNPADHGIFGFTEIMPGTYTLAFPDFNWLKEATFWQKDSQKRYVILNVPATYPVKELNGVHISGFISPDLEQAVFPQDHLPRLKKDNYEVDVDSSLAHQSMSLFLEKLRQANEARIRAYRYFWQKEAWDVFMLVFTGSDRLMHFLWDAYEEESHLHRQDFLNYFRRVDEVIGEIATRISPDDSLLILSDHGMARIKTNFYVNQFLKENGFLDLDETQKGYNRITAKTKAFALDPGRIYLHKKRKYPRGQVEKEDEANLIEKLIQVFLKVELGGEKVIREVYRREEIYQGRQIEKAPDLVLVGASGYRLRGAIDKNILFGDDIFTGDHTLDDAFLWVKNGNAQEIVPDNPTVEDVVSVLDQL